MISKKKSAFAIALLLVLCGACQVSCNSDANIGGELSSTKPEELAAQQDAKDARSNHDELPTTPPATSTTSGTIINAIKTNDSQDLGGRKLGTQRAEWTLGIIGWGIDANGFPDFLERGDVTYDDLVSFIGGLGDASRKVTLAELSYPSSVPEETLRSCENKLKQLNKLQIRCGQRKDDRQALLKIYDQLFLFCEPGVDYAAPDSDE